MSKITSQRNFILDYWKTIVITVIICYLSFAPSSSFKSIPQFAYSDKITHFLMYLVLTVVIINDFYKRNKVFSGIMFFLTCILLPVFAGGAIEIIQEIFTATRSGDWFDWTADVIGVLLGWLFSILWIKRKN